ncbi:MAG TPA: hypothetical protein VFL83_01540 [Anaeromyxobacter sp.]|nr:hypothetical protein [Anaeromyxobacter sp.]
MDPIWLLKGPYEAPGWKLLEADSRAQKIDLLLFDRAAWALACAPQAPTQYEGLAPSVPADGLYLDDQGRGIYVVAGKLVQGPREVLATLGAQGEEMLKKVGDPDVALERLGRVY